MKDELISTKEVVSLLNYLDENDIRSILKIFSDVASDALNGKLDAATTDLHTEILTRFKAEQLRRRPMKELIGLMNVHNVKIDDTGARLEKVPFILNKEQEFLLDRINKNRHVVYAKYRQEGITSLLAAYTAIKAYINPGAKIAFVNPYNNMNREVFAKILDFISQMQGISFTVGYTIHPHSHKMIKLLNGSEIWLFSECDKDKVRGLRDFDDVIIEETSLFKKYLSDFEESIVLILKPDGKLIETYTFIDKKICFDE